MTNHSCCPCCASTPRPQHRRWRQSRRPSKRATRAGPPAAPRPPPRPRHAAPEPRAFVCAVPLTCHSPPASRARQQQRAACIRRPAEWPTRSNTLKARALRQRPLTWKHPALPPAWRLHLQSYAQPCTPATPQPASATWPPLKPGPTRARRHVTPTPRQVSLARAGCTSSRHPLCTSKL